MLKRLTQFLMGFGSFLIAVGLAETVSLLAEDLKPKATLNHNLSVRTVAFSPDGKMLASGTVDDFRNNGNVMLWEPATGKQTKVVPIGTRNTVFSMAFSPDGRILAAGCAGYVKLWDMPAGTEKESIQEDSLRSVWSLSFSPDGKTLAICSNEGHSFDLWDLTTRKKQSLVPPGNVPWNKDQRNVNHVVAFSPVGGTLATTSEDRVIRFWDVKTGKETASLKGHTNRILCLAFSPDGQTLVSGSGDFDANGKRLPGEVRLWNVGNRKQTALLKGHTEGVRTVAFTPDGKTLASGSFDKTIKLWNIDTGLERATLKAHTDDVLSVAFSPDGKILASASSDKTVRLWDAADIPKSDK